ncbi:MAG TPA: AAA family ATPase [Ktedonobacterales bacterium]|nr:AAA family ATPase [Ktedonobacterales bacterium]
MMIHLQSVELRVPETARRAVFPFDVPSIASLDGNSLAFPSEVTFLIGENGSGKSTLLEGLACAIGSIAVGSEPVEHDPSLREAQALARAMRLRWTERTRRGFFLRSEDFFGYARRMKQVREELEADLREVETDASLSPTARAYGSLPYAREIGDLHRRYGASLDAHSHGESFFTLFQSRFVPDGLYLLDEPEAPLSPVRQLSLISMLSAMVKERHAQFIIATHSPILMALPGATLYSFDGGRVHRIAYEETEHFRITRDFLNNPSLFLRHLSSDAQ